MYLVIPARNEEKRIGRTIREYLEYFPDMNIVIALTNCTDDTLRVVKEIMLEHENRLEYIDIEPIKGNSKGKAIRDAFLYVLEKYNPDYIGFVDADDSIGPLEFAKLKKVVVDYDVVISSRYLPESFLKERDSILRIIASHLYRKYVAILFSLPYSDTQCGGKIYKNSVLKKILPKQAVNDMTFDVEMLYLAKQAGFTIEEIPIIWRENIASTISTSKFKFITTSWQMLMSLLRMRIRFWFK